MIFKVDLQLLDISYNFFITSGFTENTAQLKVLNKESLFKTILNFLNKVQIPSNFLSSKTYQLLIFVFLVIKKIVSYYFSI